MIKLQNETRAQAVARFNRDGGSEADYIRSVPLEMANGSTETLTHCQICLAHLENGFIKHLHYCPFEGAADRLREAAPALLKALTDKLPSSLPSSDFPADLDTIAGLIDDLGYSATARELRAKAQAIRAATAAAEGESPTPVKSRVQGGGEAL